MERTIAARSPVGPFDLVWRPFEALAGLGRALFETILRHRRLRIALLAVLIALPLLAGGWMLLRKSSFVTVEHVRVRGVHGPEAPAIETALAGAARHMSTLDVSSAALRAAVAAFPVVRAIRATPSFPHGLRIDVVEQPPVAAVMVGAGRTAVAADGVVLGPALLSGSLPTLSESASAALVGQRVHGASVRGALTVLGAAPAALAGSVKRVYTSPEGLTVVLGHGLLAYFGDASRPHAKWLSLARVLADPSSAGAAYVDVRLPERPAAGFAAGVAPGTATATGAEAGSVSDPSTAAELAAGLSASVGGGSSNPSSATPSTGSAEAAGGVTHTETPASSAEARTTAPAEAPPARAGEASAAPPAAGG